MTRWRDELSQLEREFELELEPLETEPSADAEVEAPRPDTNAVASDDRADELASDGVDDELDVGPADERFADRLMELSERGFDSEEDLDSRLGTILGEMEREYFLGGLLKKIKRAGGGLLKKGIAAATRGLPIASAVQSVTQLARGNLKGMLGSLAKTAIASAAGAVPGGAVLVPALQNLGFGGSGASNAAADPAATREAWRNFVEMARTAYGTMADAASEELADPIEASRAAASAFQTALQQAPRARRREPRRTHRIRVRPGDVIVIEAE